MARGALCGCSLPMSKWASDSSICLVIKTGGSLEWEAAVQLQTTAKGLVWFSLQILNEGYFGEKISLSGQNLVCTGQCHGRTFYWRFFFFIFLRFSKQTTSALPPPPHFFCFLLHHNYFSVSITFFTSPPTVSTPPIWINTYHHHFCKYCSKYCTANLE